MQILSPLGLLPVKKQCDIYIVAAYYKMDKSIYHTTKNPSDLRQKGRRERRVMKLCVLFDFI